MARWELYSRSRRGQLPAFVAGIGFAQDAAFVLGEETTTQSSVVFRIGDHLRGASAETALGNDSLHFVLESYLHFKKAVPHVILMLWSSLLASALGLADARERRLRHGPGVKFRIRRCDGRRRERARAYAVAAVLDIEPSFLRLGIPRAVVTL